MEPLSLRTPSLDHLQFELICADVDDFEPLPAVASGPLDLDEDASEQTELDGRILAALVTPVY